ncbi:NADH-quinone oxidoreductase subunit N [Actinokineospora sp.]|uniref:NADH-quinone oxidoreductase subunit N n=1 Tax=Actinokineospora sp. TaxID=1872133 RepID=UPI0040378EE3
MPTVQSIDYLAIAPPLVLALAALAVLVADTLVPQRLRGWIHGGAVAGTLLAVGVEVPLAIDVLSANRPRGTFCVGTGEQLSCSYVVDEFTVLFQVVMLVAAVVVLLMAHTEVRDTRLPVGEFCFLVLAALSGALALVAGRDLITLVVCLEVVSLPLFALVALRRYDGRSSEAGLKMFLVSVISTAVMLFGISLVYGVTGTMFLDRMAVALAEPGPLGGVATVGVVLVLVGFGFKVSAVPFHFWAPDTYQGAPVSVAAFLAVVSKAAGFAGLILVLTIGFGPYSGVWGPLVAVLAAVSMTVGNLVALRQRTPMRLLAWSSIAQAGYMLAPLGAVGGIAAGATRQAELDELIAATVGYVAIYSVMNIGVFAVIAFIGWIGKLGGGNIDDYRGLARSHPAVAIALAFFLACLAGLPPGLAGLFAKIVVFRGVVDNGYGWLAVVMAVNTVIGLYYYLAWAARLFGPRPAGQGVHFGQVSAPVGAAILMAAVATVAMSVLPQLVLGIAPFGTTGG